MAANLTPKPLAVWIKKSWARLAEWIERRRWLLMIAIFVAMLGVIVGLLVKYREVNRKKEICEETVVVIQTQLVECEAKRASLTPSTMPTATPTWTPTPTHTLTPTFTPSPTPTDSPTPLPTPTYTATPLPTPTSTSTPTPIPTDTPSPTPSPTDMPSPSPTPPRPAVLGITPISMTRVPDSTDWLTVVITGYDFVATPLPTVRLRNVQAVVLTATTEIITATIPCSMAAGVYGLVVTNDGGEPGVLPRAFTVYEPPDPFDGTTLESSYLVTFGGQTGWSLGDYDQVQLLFVGVPDSLTDSLHLRIFDPDVGGPNFLDEIIGLPMPDTAITYTLYGLTQTYTLPEARAAHPPPAGITSGTVWTSVVMPPGDTWDGKWYLFHSFSPADGELVDGRRVFKLAVQGAKEGDDGNLYNVVMSGSPDANTVISGVRLFAFSWTWLVHDSGGRHRPHLYLYVPEGTAKVQPHFFPEALPFQNGNGCVLICTPLDCLSATQVEYPVGSGEAGATWTIDMSNCELQDPYRRYAITFWAEDQGGVALPIFSRPTISPPP